MSDELDSLIQDFAARVRSKGALPVLHKPFGQRPTTKRLEPTPGTTCAEKASFEVARLAAAPWTHDVDSIDRAKSSAVQIVLERAAKEAFAKYKSLARTADAAMIQNVFVSTVTNECDTIIAAAKAHSKLVAASVKNTKDKCRIARETARSRLAAELKAARKLLRDIRRTMAGENAMLEQAISARVHAAHEQWKTDLANARLGYPDVPPPSIVPHEEGEGLPATPGIYFLWNGCTVEYVGQSIRLSNRLRLGGHNKLKADHRISFVPLDAHSLTFAECYYIGVLRPFENFGNSASHRRYNMPEKCPPVLVIDGPECELSA